MCLQSSSTLLHTAVLHSSVWMSNLALYGYTGLPIPFIPWWDVWIFSTSWQPWLMLWMFMCKFLCRHMLSFLLGRARVGLLHYMVTPCLTLRNWKTVSQKAYHVTFPTAVFEGPNMSKSLPTLGCLFWIYSFSWSDISLQFWSAFPWWPIMLSTCSWTICIFSLENHWFKSSTDF